MIELISSALICILRLLTSRRYEWRPYKKSNLRQGRPQPRKLAADRPVIHCAADPDFPAADHAGIDVYRQIDLASRNLFELRTDGGLLLGRERPGGRYLDSLPIGDLVGQLAERFADFPDLRDPV